MIEAKETIKNLYRTKEESRLGYLRLDKNDSVNTLPYSFVKKVLKEVTPEMIATYPEYSSIESKIAKHYNIKKQNIMISNGSDSVIKSIFEAYICPSDIVLLTNPTFAMYKVYCKMFDSYIREVSYTDFDFPYYDFYINLKDKVKLAIIVNPNNPMGSIIRENELEKILEKTQRKGTLLIVDEAYQGIFKKTALQLIEQYNNLIVLRTFSKLLGMATLRVGYAIASSNIIDILKKTKPTFDVNGLACLFAEKVIENKEIMKMLEKEFEEGKNYICNQLRLNNFHFILSKTNFILIKCNVKKVMIELKKKKILVGGNFSHPLLKDYIRVTVGNIKYMKKFWSVFIEVCK